MQSDLTTDVLDVLSHQQRSRLDHRSAIIGGNLESLGLPVSTLRRLSREILKRVKPSREQVLATFRTLAATSTFEFRMIAIMLLGSMITKDGRNADVWTAAEEALTRNIADWASCDTLATDVLARATQTNREAYRLAQWLKRKNPWLRRAAIVSLIKAKSLSQRKQHLISAIRVLEGDEDAYVRKALGWAQRELTSG